ncbi:sigma factor [Streptosporangium sp. NPDC048047]|uniref:sigma factor n=1 Tax=Streptosporangium sp. NPDC048047 TaxID=3155748 RepID=UPI00344950AA
MGAVGLQGDADLLAATRRGNAAAYGALYERHAPAARILARRLVRDPVEAETAVAETFTALLLLVRDGGGPREAFRPWLLAALRRTVRDRGRGKRGPGRRTPPADPAPTGPERAPMARVFFSLPERWRLVLWHTGAERAGPAEVAPLLGLAPDGAAALARTAREGLRQAYIRARLGGDLRIGCRPALRKMPAHLRGDLERRAATALEEHMDGCAGCHGVFLELADVGRTLRRAVGPLVAGPAFPAYLAGLERARGVRGRFRRWRVPGSWWRPLAAVAAVVALTATATLAAALTVASAGGPPVSPSGSPPSGEPFPSPGAPSPASPADRCATGPPARTPGAGSGPSRP